MYAQSALTHPRHAACSVPPAVDRVPHAGNNVNRFFLRQPEHGRHGNEIRRRRFPTEFTDRHGQISAELRDQRGRRQVISRRKTPSLRVGYQSMIARMVVGIGHKAVEYHATEQFAA